MTWTTRPRSELGGASAVVAGDGPPVLLLHGVGLRAEAWAAQIDALSDHARVVAPDMPGHGDSKVPDGGLTFADYSAAAAAVLDTFGDPALVVGHSMGAMLALDLADKAPDRVAGVAALNAVFERDAHAASAVQARAAALDGQTRADPTPTLERWFGTDQSPERDACTRWLGDIAPPAYAAAYAAFAHSTVPNRAALTRLSSPALFMTGASEPNSTPAMSHEMARLAPKGRALIVDGAAHMMPMTHAAEVNAALLALMAEVFA